jgi:hypothetical protein
MIKCANCSKDAVYQYNITDTYVVYYCLTDLPSFLKGKSPAASLKSLVTPPAPKKKKAATTPVEETPEDE